METQFNEKIAAYYQNAGKNLIISEGKYQYLLGQSKNACALMIILIVITTMRMKYIYYDITIILLF